jgi:ATP phosphoribosyltransferase regulatory subunit
MTGRRQSLSLSRTIRLRAQRMTNSAISNSQPDLLPEGLEDRLPREAAATTRVMRAVHGVMHGHGYDRVLPPMVEFDETLGARMAGIRSRRMFRFVDPQSLRMLILRGDHTPQIGRIAASRLAAAARPLRLCYAGQIMLIRGDGLDPAREKLQCGAEVIGSDSVAAASEIVAMAIEALAAAGATGISVDFTLPDLVDVLAARALPLPADAIEGVRRELDTKDAGGLVDAGGAAYVPLLYATGDFDSAIERLAQFDSGGVLAGRIAALREIAARLGGRARLTLDPSERHGFEYQSWFGFTVYAQGVRGILGRGGTYRIAGPNGGEAATGCSLFPDALIDLLADAEPQEDRVFLPLGHDAEVAARLRAGGWRTVAALTEGDNAAGLGCSHALTGDGPVAV